MQKILVLQVGALPNDTLTDMCTRLGFGAGNGDHIAKWFAQGTRWPEDHLVWLCPPQGQSKFDCVHSVYASVMQSQAFCFDLLGVHGLFCLAVHLKQRPYSELASFTGVVHAFNGSMLNKKTSLNHTQKTARDAYDLVTPVLYLEQGRPRSIYHMYHTDEVEDARLIAFCGSTTVLDLKEEQARLAA